MKKISLKINGKEYNVEIEKDMRLLDLLRDQLHLTGTKEGCGEGECGACTVIMDGVTVNSCMVLAFQADGSEIITIEGLDKGDKLHPIQKAFLDEGAVQCGFCIPGMVLSAKALLDKKPSPSRKEIREGISGNLCRCTGYNKIVDAIDKASQYLKEEGEEK
ncbi:(2Fe-2S)-binding protein [Alkaliphilus peptidifermentans]|uniref:Purine hydroxylase delta subunit apoprotein n=1 Tax=Alkaliphilus peptidifermentans DSM 18978 TaxID=1120976 RepID=A0A1G5KVY7_9FIRM|nr:(2Fe-2S)-binding protein [Alkaliphilus peptidifermentans]SCZ04776.1 purine hydroxylase delta subunit apoprotein [Alkaliphilus peptidifermentans DSM 18978]